MLGRHLGLFSDRIEHDLAPEFRADLRAILKRAAERNFQTEPKADMTKFSDAELETLSELLTKVGPRASEAQRRIRMAVTRDELAPYIIGLTSQLLRMIREAEQCH